MSTTSKIKARYIAKCGDFEPHRSHYMDTRISLWDRVWNNVKVKRVWCSGLSDKGERYRYE